MVPQRDAAALTKSLRERLPELSEQYSVESLALFGSWARGEQSPDSDLDVLVTFRENPSLLRFIELEGRLSDLLEVKVDLVMRTGLKPAIGERILEEAVPV